MTEHYDFLIIGSGFGGSVSALRLAEKGYRVLVIEKGRRFAEEDFPTSNWDVRNWMWMPSVGAKGLFKMSFFEHVTILHGVGVGGGSLVYANTLPTPTSSFFRSSSWGHLAEWESELAPHYRTARRMLGATPNPHRTPADAILKEIAEEIGRPDHFRTTEVGVYFGTPGQRVPDPYFGGKGPDRVGCTQCGACMTGCRVGAKNTLDRNYLYLAEKLGAEVLAETEVRAVRARADRGYQVETVGSLNASEKRSIRADRVIFAGGVMGTIPLLLRMRDDPEGLPRLSPRVGDSVRTNSEALIGVISTDRSKDFSRGVAITSILHTDEHSHVEPCRYGADSSFFRLLALPHAPGPTVAGRLASTARGFLKEPLRWSKALTTNRFSSQTTILLYMRTLEGTISLRLGKNLWTGFREGLVTRIDDPSAAPTAFMDEATDIARRFAEKARGVSMTLLTETLMGVPSTAHILGGAVMSDSPESGVIDAQHRAFGYDGLYVIDGSAVSANPGVNPSLTITALAERAMSFIPPKPA